MTNSAFKPIEIEEIKATLKDAEGWRQERTTGYRLTQSVRVESEDLLTGEVRHTASAYLTFVSLDASGHPTEIPQLIVESEEEVRRHRQALDRRAVRLEERAREKVAH